MTGSAEKPLNIAPVSLAAVYVGAACEALKQVSRSGDIYDRPSALALMHCKWPRCTRLTCVYKTAPYCVHYKEKHWPGAYLHEIKQAVWDHKTNPRKHTHFDSYSCSVKTLRAATVAAP